MTMKCVECRELIIFDDMYIFDGMFVCSDCYDKLELEEFKK